MNHDVVDAIVRAVGADVVLREPGELLPFESDGLARLRERPGLVVFPSSAADVQAIAYPVLRRSRSATAT